MTKMFLTQLNGLHQRIFEKEAYSIEDTARLLAQALIGEGKIYIKGYNEMTAIQAEAFNGLEPLTSSEPLESIENLTDADRVLIITRFSNDIEAVSLASELYQKRIPFAAIAGKISDEGEDISHLADVFINTSLLKPMLPSETGERIGFPSALTGLFIYHCIKFELDEMMNEYL